MRTLTQAQTIERIYAGWLGKLIGVRLGAPVEMWTSEQILEKYGEAQGYLMDYNEFAADDDTNGPTFFIRAMEDSGHYTDMTAQDVGHAWLNYAPWGKGMYWWGGYGVSSEHTAYENLRAGVPAPRSGSCALNGKELSDQIGGQIFSDAWGLVAPGNPALAAELSEKAASVSHDGEAIYGGRFVAAAIAAAFTLEDIDAVIEAGLAQIPADSQYTAVFRAVQAFYRANPEDWKACLTMLREDFWRDTFGGNCHIIPNAGIMAIGLYYGQGDFDRTLTLCNYCGFDTDCNVGNLGAILGTLVGLEGIKQHWRAPINDFYACSSVVGVLNLQDAADFSLYLARLAGRLGTLVLPESMDALPKINFLLPGSTHACLWETDGMTRPAFGRWTDSHGGALRLPLAAGTSRCYHRTYMRPKEFTDDRYSPAFSPKIYPGQTAVAEVMGQEGMRARLYVYDDNAGQEITGEWIALTADQPTQLTFQIPAMDGACLSRVGVQWDAPQGGEALLLSMDWAGQSDYAMDFAKERVEWWSFHHHEVSQLTRLKGYWRLEDGALVGSASDLGEVYTGDVRGGDGIVSCTLTPLSGKTHRLLFRVQGGARAYAAELTEGKLSLCRNACGWTQLASIPFDWAHNVPVHLEVTLRANALEIVANGEARLSYTDTTSPLSTGMVGMAVASGSCCRFEGLSVRPLR